MNIYNVFWETELPPQIFKQICFTVQQYTLKCKLNVKVDVCLIEGIKGGNFSSNYHCTELNSLSPTADILISTDTRGLSIYNYISLLISCSLIVQPCIIRTLLQQLLRPSSSSSAPRADTCSPVHRRHRHHYSPTRTQAPLSKQHSIDSDPMW